MAMIQPSFSVTVRPRNCWENFTFARYADRWVSTRMLNDVGGCDVESCNFLPRAPIVFFVPCGGHQWRRVWPLDVWHNDANKAHVFRVINPLISVAFWWCEEQDQPDKFEQICILLRCSALVRSISATFNAH